MPRGGPSPLSEEELQAAVDAYIANGRNAYAAARQLNLAPMKYKYRLDAAARKGLIDLSVKAMPGFEIKRTSVQLGPDGEKQKEWIEQKPEAGPEFQVPEGHQIKGVSALVGPDGRTISQWIKTTETGWSFDDLKAALGDALADYAGKSPIMPVPDNTEDTAALYALPDMHVGLLSWGKETGTNWDLSIARKAYGEAIHRLIGLTAPSKQAVIIGLGDMLHADGFRNATPASGNALDVDGRYPRVLQTTAQLLIDATNAALAKHEHVLIRLLAGNHDPESTVALTLAIGMFYQNNPRVKVDDDPGLYWFWEYGSNFIGAHHGHEAAMQDLPLIMAARHPKEWGRTKHRLILTGHVHKLQVMERPGATVVSLRAPVAQDAWSFGKGFHAGRTLTAATLHKERGQTGQQYVSLA